MKLNFTAICVLIAFALPAFAQIGAIREETKTTNPDGSVTFTRKFDPPVQAPQAPVYAEPVTIYRTVTTYRSAPVFAAPVYDAAPMYAVMYAPVGAKTPVGSVRYGLLGLRREVYHADGTSTRYGPLGRRR